MPTLLFICNFYIHRLSLQNIFTVIKDAAIFLRILTLRKLLQFIYVESKINFLER